MGIEHYYVIAVAAYDSSFGTDENINLKIRVTKQLPGKYNSELRIVYSEMDSRYVPLTISFQVNSRQHQPTRGQKGHKRRHKGLDNQVPSAYISAIDTVHDAKGRLCDDSSRALISR